jgi:Flp pilus assembly protein TadD
MRLAIAAASGRRGAVAEARALADAHRLTPPWRRPLATTLGAAGRLGEAKELLVTLVTLDPTASLREELAYVEAALGREREARAILDALRRQPAWRGSPTRHLPHLRAHAQRLGDEP